MVEKIARKILSKTRAFGGSPKYREKVMAWAIKSSIRSSIYYCLFNKEFDDEHFAVLNGVYAYAKNHASMGPESTARRNLHRIEKGLSLSKINPTRKVFAEDFIIETIESLIVFLDNVKVNGCLPTHCVSFQKWAFDVLDEYFLIVDKTPKVKQAHNEYLSIRTFNNVKLDFETKSIPYQYVLNSGDPLSFDELSRIMHRRHSVRWYEDKLVTDDVIKKAIDLALTSPSACNRQAFRVIAVNRGEALNQVRALKLGFDTFADNIYTFLLIVGDLSAYKEERDKHLIYIDGSLFAMSLMLGFEALGVSTCPINYPDLPFLHIEMAKILELKEYERGVMLMSLGYASPTGYIPYSQKKTSDNVLTIVR